MIAALQFSELLIFEFKTLLIVTAFIGFFVFDANEPVVLGREEVTAEVCACECMVVLLSALDFIHCMGLVLVWRWRFLCTFIAGHMDVSSLFAVGIGIHFLWMCVVGFLGLGGELKLFSCGFG
jgi:hypothetical protein